MSIDREKQILEILLKEKKSSVKQLAKILFVSEPSVRRDLQSLEKQNLIKRIHGGAERACKEHKKCYRHVTLGKC